MSEADRLTSRGKRGAVIGRRLPWTGVNFPALRSARWQVHVYGPVDQRVAVRFTRHMPVEFLEFDSVGATALQPGRFYLVRPDGFVAADADPSKAAEHFRRVLTDWGVDPDRLMPE